MQSVPTFTATIYCGLRVGRSNDPTPKFHDFAEAESVCQAYCDEAGLGLTLTPTTFIYTNGSEPGCIVGLINYPRFPSDPDQIRHHALALAERLRVALEQWRVSVVFPDETVMLGDGAPDYPERHSGEPR